MKKRYIIILIVIVSAIIILAAINFFKEQNKKTSQQTEESSESQAGDGLPDLPGIDRKEFTAGGQNSLSEQIDSYVDSQTESRPSSGENKELKDIQFKDKEGNPIPLNDFEKAVGIKVDDQLQKYLKSGDYSFMVCSGKDGEENHGLLLNIRLLSKEETFPDVIKILSRWEPSMLSDLSGILFKNASLGESDLSKKMEFKDGKYRYAELTLENGKKISLNYVWVDDYVIFATSLECTDEIYDYVYGAD
ncbi:MAG: hypothetical protein WC831_04555 [Parcubacteria group bacterium]|jgi:hypothetical protein